MKLINFYPCKKAENVKGKIFSKKFFYCAYYGLDTETEPYPNLSKSEPEP